MNPAPDHTEDASAAHRDEVAEFLRVAREHNLELEALQVFKRIGALETVTKWDETTLRAQLGCDLMAFAQAGADRAPRSLALSDQYLAWLRELVSWLGEMPAPSMARRIVVAARTLFDGAGGDRDAARLERCRMALSTEHNVSYRPRSYLELGEIQRAFDVAAGQLVDTEASARATAVETARAQFEGVVPHVHPKRLSLIGRPAGIEQLGVGVHDAIVAHLHGGCAACNDALPSGVVLPVTAQRAA